MRHIISIIVVIFSLSVCGQSYTSYFTGNTTDLEVAPTFGITLMGGATEDDNASRWFLERANGGDILVLRASGSDGYNDYFYSELGVAVNSVETIVINNAQGALEPYVLNKIQDAEAIWFAGGDQYDYVTFFKNNEVEALLNDHINFKQGVIGGTSAGMAILGQSYFSAENGTVTSAQAITNPYDEKMAIGHNDFVDIPLLENTITDTHFDSPDRRGRLTAFLARMVVDQNIRSRAIASEEYVAVCIDQDGNAQVFGGFPEFQDFAYFAQANCSDNFIPEDCSPDNVLLWDRGGEAVKVYKVPGTASGENTFNVANWSNGTGGEWLNWWVSGSTFQTSESENPNCNTLGVLNNNIVEKILYPNPARDEIRISLSTVERYSIYNALGKTIAQGFIQPGDAINIQKFQDGLYFIEIEGSRLVTKFIKY